jgi:manganese/zinc/iron transport system permease protein
MTSAQFEIQIIASVVAIACAIPGVFLVLRKMAMISDAISHSILPGIVLGFFAVQDLSSPLLVILAAFTGILTVILVELTNKTGLVKEDTAIGLVFPALFSIGVILIARNAGDVHLDTDAVLVGDLAFAPFDRFFIGTTDLGPKSLWVMGGILILTIGFLFAFFKELKISTFDAGLATSLGFSPSIIHYGLMTLTSITTVGAFDAVGAILVVALMIVPAAISWLLTDNLKKMIMLSAFFGVLAALSGYWLAHLLDVSISGSMATVLGMMFFISFIFAPDRGLVSVLIRQRYQKREYSLLTFLLHIKNHSEAQGNPEEIKVRHLTGHFNWQKNKASLILELGLKNSMIEVIDNTVFLTPKGEDFTREAIDYIINNNKAIIEPIERKFLLYR